MVRATGDPAALSSLVQARIRELDSSATVDDITTMARVVDRASAPWRMSMWMFVLFAGVAFFLAAVGLFSLMSLDVAHRRREFAVRLALGASGGTVLGSVLTSAAWKAGLGVAAGLIAAAATTRLMTALLYDVRPLDARTYAAVIVMVIVVVTIAAFVPAARAGRTDPASLMRE
jgi:putative ABC transport system permease protein